MAESTTKPASDDDQVGRPIGKDEIDPELVSLRKPALRVGPLLAVSVIVLCTFLLFQLRQDLRFSRQSGKPTQIDDIRELAAGKPGPESYVRTRAAADYSFAFTVAESLKEDGHRLVPALGTGNRVWILFGGSARKARVADDDYFQGRVRRLSDMPFYAAVKRRVSKRIVKRFVTATAVRDALGKKAAAIATPFGDTIALTADTPVTLTQHHAHKSVVRVWATDSYPEKYWSDKLTAAKLGAQKPKRVQGREYLYAVNAPAADVQAKLNTAKLVMPEVSPLEIVHKKKWGELSGDASGLMIEGKRVPWTSLATVSFGVKRPLPGDAVVIITDQQPGHFWYVLPIMIVLGAFALLFIFALALQVRTSLLARNAATERNAPA